MRKIYLDMDDTLVDTEVYLRKVLRANGYSCPKYETVYTMYGLESVNHIFKEVLSDYSAIPKKVGAEECIRVLETEYELVFLSCYSTEYEKKAKENLALQLNKDIILCEGFKGKDTVDINGGILLDDTPRNLLFSGLPSKDQYLMYNPYALDRQGIRDYAEFKGNVVTSWYDFTDKVMEVEEDAELREYICARVQKLGKGSRV